jgi:hypothetical protein
MMVRTRRGKLYHYGVWDESELISKFWFLGKHCENSTSSSVAREKAEKSLGTIFCNGNARRTPFGKPSAVEHHGDYTAFKSGTTSQERCFGVFMKYFVATVNDISVSQFVDIIMQSKPIGATSPYRFA